MSDSAPRLLEGIAVALAEDVSPHVSDPFAQMQCKAAAELLGNLATELDWAPEPIQRRNAELRALLDGLRQAGWPSPLEADPSLPSEQVQAALLGELGDALRWLADQDSPAREAVDQLLRADLERQVATLRRGMFR